MWIFKAVICLLKFMSGGVTDLDKSEEIQSDTCNDKKRGDEM